MISCIIEHINNATGENEMNAPATIEKIAGRTIELTIRGDKSFTLSFDCIDKIATSRLVKFFGNACQVEENEECGTFIYVEA